MIFKKRFHSNQIYYFSVFNFFFPFFFRPCHAACETGSPTTDQTHSPHSESVEAQLLDHQRNLSVINVLNQKFVLDLIYLFLAALGLAAVQAFLQPCQAGLLSRVACGLTAVASFVVEHGSRARGSVVVLHELSHLAACGIFPDQRSNICPLHWQADY